MGEEKEREERRERLTLSSPAAHPAVHGGEPPVLYWAGPGLRARRPNVRCPCVVPPAATPWCTPPTAVHVFPSYLTCMEPPTPVQPPLQCNPPPLRLAASHRFVTD